MVASHSCTISILFGKLQEQKLNRVADIQVNNLRVEAANWQQQVLKKNTKAGNIKKLRGDCFGFASQLITNNK